MKSAVQIAPNSKKSEESSSKKKTEISIDLLPRKRTISQKDVKRINIKTPDDVTPKQRTPTVSSREREVKPLTPGNSGSLERKKKDNQRKTVNLIIKKSFTYVDSGTSIAIFGGRGNSINKEGLPPRSPVKEGKKDPIRRIPATVVKATKPVTPVKNITMPGKSSSRQSITSEQIKKGAKKVESVCKSPKDTGSTGSTKSIGKRVKKKKEWDDNFTSVKKELPDEQKKKVNFETEVYRELMTQALASSSKKMMIEQGKSRYSEEKRFKAKQGQPKAKKSPVRAKSVESKGKVQVEIKAPEEKPKEFEEEVEKLKEEIKERLEVAKNFEVAKKFEEVLKIEEVPKLPEEVIKELEEVIKKPDKEPKICGQEPEEPPEPKEDSKPPAEEPPVIEETTQQIEEVDKGSLIDKLRHELQMNILNKLYIRSGSKINDSKEKVPEAASDKSSNLNNLMSSTNQRKPRWNLKSYPLKRKRIKGTVDDRCNASLTDGKLYDDAVIKLKRHNTEPHSYRGFIWRHSSEMPNNCNDYSVTSLASSLRHLNTDDLEDFVFWETVPPKSTSCWEVSLYQSKKPWSVLSCSVFQSNRLSDTPGVILENLRSGRSYDSRITYNAPVKALPKSISFDVEPSIAQKNIDIRNWVAALNFETPEPPPILTERTLSDQPPHQIVPENLPGKCVHGVPSDCMFKEKKMKIKHVNDGKKTPGKRARSAFDEHTKMQLSIPPAENMSLINGVFLAKGVKVLDYDKKNDIIKTLITRGSPVKEQTNVVYMMHMSNKSPLKSASERVRKSRDGRKSQGEPSTAKSRENTSARSNTPNRRIDEALEGLIRKCSGGFVTVEQYKDGKRPGEKVNFSGVEKIVTLTDFADEGNNSHDSDDARPYSAGRTKHKHESDAPTGVCCLGEYRQLKPEESRKARMDYGRFALEKEIEEKRRRARTKSRTRTRSRHRQVSSILKLVTRRYSNDDNSRCSSFSLLKIIFIFLILIAGVVGTSLKMGWIPLIYLLNFKEILATVLDNFLNFINYYRAA